uniref:Uncharacterized protein n=1 Tax=Anguilla anguilla TaxID=7936 RepID=A0A0E9XAU0_ANGAN
MDLKCNHPYYSHV